MDRTAALREMRTRPSRPSNRCRCRPPRLGLPTGTGRRRSASVPQSVPATSTASRAPARESGGSPGGKPDRPAPAHRQCRDQHRRLMSLLQIAIGARFAVPDNDPSHPVLTDHTNPVREVRRQQTRFRHGPRPQTCYSPAGLIRRSPSLPSRRRSCAFVRQRSSTGCPRRPTPPPDLPDLERA